MQTTTTMKDIARGSQSTTYTEHLTANANGKILALKIEIKSDAYEYQSYATVRVFDTTSQEWKPLADIPFSKMSTPHTLYVHKREEWDSSKTYRTDRNNLIEKAAAILESAYPPAPSPTMKEFVEACATAADLIEEAITTHIYNDDNGEKPRPDCNYTNHAAALRKLIARAA